MSNIFGDWMKQIGHPIDCEGKQYVRIDQQTWLTDKYYVTVDIVMESPASFPILTDLKCLVTTKPRTKPQG